MVNTQTSSKYVGIYPSLLFTIYHQNMAICGSFMAKFHFAASRPSWSFHRGEGSEGLSWCVPFFGKALGPNGAFPPVSGTKTQAWRAENNENQWAVCRWEFASFGVDENAAERHSWHGTGTTDDWWEALARKFQATKWWFLKLHNEIVMNSPKKSLISRLQNEFANKYVCIHIYILW